MNRSAGSMTLAGAEYEGEHCLQVTLRTIDDSKLDRLPNGAVAASGEAAIPTLTDSHAQAGNENVSGLEFELELEDSNPVQVPELAPATNSTDAAIDLVDSTVHAQPEETQTAGTQANSLEAFLDAGERYLNDNNAGFAGVFIAQVDGYQDMQQSYGLTGVDRICTKVQTTLAQAAADQSAPNMALSAFQWAVIVSAEGKQQALDLIERIPADHRRADAGGQRKNRSPERQLLAARSLDQGGL